MGRWGSPGGVQGVGQLAAAGAPWGRPSPSTAEQHGLWGEMLVTFPALP